MGANDHLGFKLVKIDGRHAGHGQWRYYVTPTTWWHNTYISVNQHHGDRRQRFLDWREWCWTTWGASKELDEYTGGDLYDGVRCSNAHWCWRNGGDGQPRIYLRDDIDATAFTLRWS